MSLAIIKLIAILNLTVSYYEYNSGSEFIEMFGYAANEYECTQAPKKDRPKYASCAAYCAAQTWWFSDSDIYEDIGGVCEYLGITDLDLKLIQERNDFR